MKPGLREKAEEEMKEREQSEGRSHGLQTKGFLILRPEPRRDGKKGVRQAKTDQIFVDRSFSILVYSQKFMASLGSRRKKTLVIAGGGVFPKKWDQLGKRVACFSADPT
jgi:hypothetical protein